MLLRLELLAQVLVFGKVMDQERGHGCLSDKDSQILWMRSRSGAAEVVAAPLVRLVRGQAGAGDLLHHP